MRVVRGAAAAALRRVVDEHGPLLVAGALAIAIVADGGWALVRGTRTPRPAIGTPAARAAPLVNRSAINALFGASPASANVVPEALSAEFELTGTIAMTDPTEGFGILRRHGQGEQSYRAGEALSGGAKLAEVYPERVVIDIGGALSTLWLPHGGARAPAATAVAWHAPPPRAVDPIVAASPPVPVSIDQRRQHPVNVPGSRVARALRPHAVVTDQRVVGYQLASGGTSPIAGLPRGAIIREINGVPLTDGVVAGQMLDSLATAGSATFVIQGGDGQHTVTVDVTNLAALASPAAHSR